MFPTFSKNLNIPVKFEPQSIYWHHDTLTVLSGIVKYMGKRVLSLCISQQKTWPDTCETVTREDAGVSCVTPSNIYS